jgi:hypothetical protein
MNERRFIGVFSGQVEAAKVTARRCTGGRGFPLARGVVPAFSGSAENAALHNA